MSTRRELAIGAIGLTVPYAVGVEIAAPIRSASRALYLPTSDLETAFETLANAPGVVIKLPEAEAIATKRFETVFRITVEKL